MEQDIISAPDLSALLIGLLKGVQYREQDEKSVGRAAQPASPGCVTTWPLNLELRG